MDTKINECLEILNIPIHRAITVSSINEHYHALIEEEPLSEAERRKNLREAKQYLIENIDTISGYQIKERADAAAQLFEEKQYAEALNTYESIRHCLPYGKEPESVLNPDDCIRYGISSLYGNLRAQDSSSALWCYGYGGEWAGSTWVNCSDHKEFPSDWDTIAANIRNLIDANPLVENANSGKCSDNMYMLYIDAVEDIFNRARKEYTEQEELRKRLFAKPETITEYIGKNNGFFKYGNELYYLYDDGNDNTYPVYKVSVRGNRIHMDFYKYSNFNKETSGILKSEDFTIKIITDSFLELKSGTGRSPSCFCRIKKEDERIDYRKYMGKPGIGRCRYCGGVSVLGICTRFCRAKLKK